MNKRRSVPTSILRGQLKDYIDEVIDEGKPIDITNFGKKQATIIPRANADMLYDLSEEELRSVQEKIGEFLKFLQENNLRSRKIPISIRDILTDQYFQSDETMTALLQGKRPRRD